MVAAVSEVGKQPTLSAWLRFLTWSSSDDELRAMSWRGWLAPALAATWLAGIGRYWDHPSASLPQMFGVGSVAYVLWLLRRAAGLTWPRTLVGSLVPLCIIVATLYALNLERAVFEIMGGFRTKTPNDGAYAILFLLTALSFYAAVPLLLAYLVLVFVARRDALDEAPEP